MTVTITNGYCDLAELKEKLGLSTANTANDVQLGQGIEAASRWIERYTGRRFYGKAETRYYTAQEGVEVYVDDLTYVSELATDEDGDGTFETTWNATEYILWPYNADADGKPYTRVEMNANSGKSFPGTRRGVRIAGTFGYVGTTASTSGCPDPIHDATLLLAERLYKRKDAPLGVMGGNLQLGQEMVHIPSVSSDPDIRDLLAPYRRLV